MTPLLLLLVTASSLFLEDVPDAFPRDGARPIIDNARVTVYDVTWPQGQPLPLHRHRHDMVGIELEDSAVLITPRGGATEKFSLTRGMAYFQARGVTHIEEAVDDARHALMIVLKDTVVSPLENQTGYPLAFPREAAVKLADNDRVVIWDYTWTTGQPTPMHFHDKDVVVVFLGKGELESQTPDGEVASNRIAFGDARFNARNRVHSEMLVSGKARTIVVELK